MRKELDRVILQLIEFGILDKLFKNYDFTTTGGDGRSQDFENHQKGRSKYGREAEQEKMYIIIGALLLLRIRLLEKRSFSYFQEVMICRKI